MAILTFPDLPIAGIRWSLLANTQSFGSPLDGSTQTRELPGARWRAELTLGTLRPAQWRRLTAWAARMRGQAGRTYLSPTHAKVPQGAAGGTPRIAGAGQTGTVLILDGAAPGVAGWLREGDFLSFPLGAGMALHMVVADAGSTSSGNVSLTIEPPLRGSPASGAAVTVASPVAVMRLADDEQGVLDITPPQLGAMTLSLVESFT